MEQLFQMRGRTDGTQHLGDTKACVGSWREQAGEAGSRRVGGVAAGCPIGPEQREGEFGTYPQFDEKTLKFFNQGSDEFVIYLWQGREGAISRKEKAKRM